MTSLAIHCIIICFCASFSQGHPPEYPQNISQTSFPRDLSQSSTRPSTENKDPRDDRDDYPPAPDEATQGTTTEKASIKGSSHHHWYVVYLKSLQKPRMTSLKDEKFTSDLTQSIASRLNVHMKDIFLNKIVLRGNELSVNFSMESLSFKEESFLKRLTRLVNNDVIAFSGDRYIIFRIVRSDNYRALGLIQGLSYTHPYSHTVTFLKDDLSNRSEHERVELMFYLTVGGLCIFLFVLALSFLAIQFMKSGALSYIDEELEDDYEDDSKHLLRGDVEDSERPAPLHLLPCISSKTLDSVDSRGGDSSSCSGIGGHSKTWAFIPNSYSRKIGARCSKWLPSSLKASNKIIDLNN